MLSKKSAISQEMNDENGAPEISDPLKLHPESPVGTFTAPDETSVACSLRDLRRSLPPACLS